MRCVDLLIVYTNVLSLYNTWLNNCSHCYILPFKIRLTKWINNVLLYFILLFHFIFISIFALIHENHLKRKPIKAFSNRPDECVKTAYLAILHSFIYLFIFSNMNTFLFLFLRKYVCVCIKYNENYGISRKKACSKTHCFDLVAHFFLHF